MHQANRVLTKWLNRRTPISPAPGAAELVRAGNALLGQGLLEDAAQHYERAAAADSGHVGARVNLGFVRLEQGRVKEAMPPLHAAVALDKDSHDARYLLGSALLDTSDYRGAAEHLEHALRLKPDLTVAYAKLANARFHNGQVEAAESVLQRGLALDPGLAALHFYLGNVLAGQMKLARAIASYRRAIAIDPGNAAVFSSMAPAYLQLGEGRLAAAAARQALAIDPSMQQARSNLLLALSSDPDCSPEAYLVEAQAYGEFVSAPGATRRRRPPLLPEGVPKRVRIGFVSGDLRAHPVGYFIEAALAHWDDARMEAVAYANQRDHDELTARLRSHFSAWRDISNLDDDAAQRLIEADGIDILVDLSGHTPGNRLPLFARRAAPVQMTWLGYWASTGVPAMDYLLADRTSLPESAQHCYTETVRYLPDTRLCFTAPTGPGVPPVAELPALTRGYITFGSFQRLTKLDDAVLRLWADVLQAIPDARLRLQSAQMSDSAARELLRQRLAAAGIESSRVDFFGPMTRNDYLAAHAEVDIILDTFPHSGATTTCEALWMGVPTLTLQGSTLLARQGAALMTSARLPAWIASDEEDFVARATAHAGDVHALARLRSTLRQTLAITPLFETRRFSSALQTVFKEILEESTCSSE